MGSIHFNDGIISYYFFQNRIAKYFSKIQYKDEKEQKVGYLINPEWIKYWRAAINYERIKAELDKLNINRNNYQSKMYNLRLFNEEKIKKLSNSIKTNNFDITRKNTFSQKFLMNLMPEHSYKNLKINYKITNIKINYILKKQMIIFVLENYRIIKIIIPDISYFTTSKNIVNLTWLFYTNEAYITSLNFLRENNSEKIMEFLINNEIFANPVISRTNDKKQQLEYMLVNEELDKKEKYGERKKYYVHYTKNSKDTNLIIKQPQEINFDLAKRISYRGLDNVGATCYMNATLQNLVNIKPITDYLLNPNKYREIYENVALCPLTLQYCQVLLGLFCDKSTTGSYSPKLFKMVIGEMNPLFQGIQANDSKDLIIFLLEVLNTELSKLHNKKHKIQKAKDEFLINIDPSDEKALLDDFLKDFRISHPSTIGANLCGFKKNVFTCQKCGGKSYNFNLFNFIIFGLEATANYFNLNNNGIPTLTFNHCFQFLLKEEMFQDTFCPKCNLTGISKYKESIYLLPNYLIIILNRGKGNIFNCNVVIPEVFDSSNYEERDKNKKYELIGVVSHFGESGMGGHFIAFCKHNMDNKWRCYNDSMVSECKNDYLQRGVPYILFYKNMNISNNNNAVSNKANNATFPNNINNLNNNQNINMPFNLQQQNLMINQQNFNQTMNNNNLQGMINMGNNIQGNMNLNNQNIGHMNIINNNLNNMNIGNMNFGNMNMNNMGNMNNINMGNLNNNDYWKY